ncbi:RagB/SusD family nutrient uptake outer membrane protein, partial [Yeosuana marina]|uniref:RagB/SusD family nutrient uptake outer membrane protein n=1 Tax=Yeosuana marina TaxID=1565536 RepID=UPI0030C8A20F
NQVFGDNLDHSETLFVYTRDEATGGAFSLAGGQPSHLSSFFNCRIYEQNSGAFIRSVEYGGDSLGWSAPNDYLQELYGELELPDPSKPWARHIVTDDLRYTTYFYPEVYVANNPDSPDFGKPIPVTDYEDNFRRYHFSLYKFHDNLTKAAATNDSWKDHLQYRLAEVYLLGAEAYFHMNGGTDATALKYINTIRRRAFTGVPNSTDTSHDFTSITLDTYLEESARELCFEGNRWYLLKRLGLLVERQGLHYRYGSNTGNIAPEPMAPYMVRFPIPQSFIDQSGGAYPQNEGY